MLEYHKMLSLILLVLVFIYLIRSFDEANVDSDVIPKRVSMKLQELWSETQSSMRENRLLKAEKSLLTILRLDHTSAAAYNRLGILYTKQKHYKDAQDCFEIACSLDPTPSSYHNLGLIYYESENYSKAALAFEQAMTLEPTVATRHIALAKVQEKLGKTKQSLEHLETAVELEPNPESYEMLAKAYEDNGLIVESSEIREKLRTLILPDARPKRMLRPASRTAVVN
jgi:tetratricopeptide (TPR) repeat protein